VFALLHLAVLTSSPFADTRTGTFGSVVHLDPEDGAPCRPFHDHDHCLFCRHLGGSVVLLAATTPLPLPIATTVPAAGAFLVADRLDLRALRRARAPPERFTKH
jgi:hypothetical protein